jgi:hypothetical protein
MNPHTIKDVDEERLCERAAAGWKRISEAYAALEPVVIERIARRVRAHVADATALLLEPSDQGGPGWVLNATILADGSRLAFEDSRTDELGDDDDLQVLLVDFGEFASSIAEPYPYELALDRAPTVTSTETGGRS